MVSIHLDSFNPTTTLAYRSVYIIRYIIITARSELRKVLFLALSASFLCMKCLGTAERTCIKFTMKTCLVFGPSLGRVWMSRSKVKVTRNKFPPNCKCIVTRSLQIMLCSSKRDHSVTVAGVMGVHRQRGRIVIYVAAGVWFMFGKTSVASSLCFLLWFAAVRWIADTVLFYSCLIRHVATNIFL